MEKLPDVYCPECSYGLNDTKAIFQRGYWWCLEHANTYQDANGELIVDFPSGGKLIPFMRME